MQESTNETSSNSQHQQYHHPATARVVVQSLVESFCQCFGTESPITSSSSLYTPNDAQQHHTSSGNHNNSSSSMNKLQRRSMSSSPLQQRQQRIFGSIQHKQPWNTLFCGQHNNGNNIDDTPLSPVATMTQYNDDIHTDMNHTTNKDSDMHTVTPPRPQTTEYVTTTTARRSKSFQSSNRYNTATTSHIATAKSSSPIITKRKRSSSSRDDIFRSKRNDHTNTSSSSSRFFHQQHGGSQQYPKGTNYANNYNTSQNSNTNHGISPFLSRFLSGSSPVCMASLCFATPIHDEESSIDEDDTPMNDTTMVQNDVHNNDHLMDHTSSSHATTVHRNNNNNSITDGASVVSDSNTLNTAEDTITSTLYYETTKLAGLKQTNPPMPLFTSHVVGDAKDDIHQIVTLRSHVTNVIHQQEQQRGNSNHPTKIQSSIQPKQQYVPSIPSPHQVLHDHNMDDSDTDEPLDDADQNPITTTTTITNKNYIVKIHDVNITPPATPPKQSNNNSNNNFTTASNPYSPRNLHPHRMIQPPSPLHPSPPPVSKLSTDSSKS